MAKMVCAKKRVDAHVRICVCVCAFCRNKKWVLVHVPLRHGRKRVRCM
jgi:hypothetical protein